MYPKVYRKEITLPDGRVISIETGKLAKQANGSVVVQMGNTMLLATATMMPEPREGADFLPLSVDYQEKFSAAGKIPGGFNKREGRLGDHEILISRLVDRAIRPMFPEGYFLETQINIFLISADATAVPDCLAALAASSAMMVSDIPFPEPVSEVRVARKDGQFHINPTPEYINGADLDLIVAATHDNIMMVEGQMNEAQEEDILEALKVAHEAIKVQCQAQVELMHEAGKTEKYDFPRLLEDDEDLKKMVFDAVYDKFYDVAKGKHDNKNVRKEKFGAVKKEFKESLPEEHGYNPDLISKYLKAAEKKAARDMVLNEGYRLDGRGTEEIRDIWGEISYLPAAHGSAVFTRGETQSLTTVTLGTKLDEQMIDQTMEKGTRKFILHYNFPGFSTGEVKPNRGPGRREVGHGNLAWRALSKAMPSQDDNPYTVRIVSDILESNGSSSMATVCAGSMALMDAGISVKGAVSGIAMGMISDPETGKYAILSDILGDEDHLGDMDFKVTGTANGVTACQMDIKIDGLSYEVLSKALSQSKRGRMHILGKMNEVISVPREDFKENAPRFEKIRIKSDQIGAVIGPGGKIVQEIQKSTGATVVIEEEGNHGVVSVFAQEKKAMEQAVKMIKEIVSEPEVGGTYNGKVKSVTTFGAFIEFMKGKEGLLHISEITWERLPSMDGVIEVGEEVTIKLIEVDEKTGKYRLSRKVLLPKPEGYVDSPASSGRDRRDRGDRNDRGDRRDRGGDRGDRRRPDRN